MNNISILQEEVQKNNGIDYNNIKEIYQKAIEELKVNNNYVENKTNEKIFNDISSNLMICLNNFSLLFEKTFKTLFNKNVDLKNLKNNSFEQFYNKMDVTYYYNFSLD